jgi:hypothetical protein
MLTKATLTTMVIGAVAVLLGLFVAAQIDKSRDKPLFK